VALVVVAVIASDVSHKSHALPSPCGPGTAALYVPTARNNPGGCADAGGSWDYTHQVCNGLAKP